MVTADGAAIDVAAGDACAVVRVDAASAPRTARLLLDSPRRPLPAAFLLRGAALYDVGAAPAELAAAVSANAASTLAGEGLVAALRDREAAKAAVRVLVRRRLGCAGVAVARFLCSAADAEIAFWLGGPPPPRSRASFGPPRKKRSATLIAHLRPP